MILSARCYQKNLFFKIMHILNNIVTAYADDFQKPELVAHRAKILLDSHTVLKHHIHKKIWALKFYLHHKHCNKKMQRHLSSLESCSNKTEVPLNVSKKAKELNALKKSCQSNNNREKACF